MIKNDSNTMFILSLHVADVLLVLITNSEAETLKSPEANSLVTALRVFIRRHKMAVR